MQRNPFRRSLLAVAAALALASCRQRAVETATATTTPAAETATAAGPAAGSPQTAVETTTTTTTTRLVTVDPVEASRHNATRRRARTTRSDASAPNPRSGEPAGSSEARLSPGSSRQHQVPEGTILRVKFDKTISTATAQVGDRATGELLDDLLADDDTVVVPSGSRVRGKVESVASSGKLAGAAQMTFRLTDLEVNGRTIPLSTSAYERKGDTHTKRNVGYIAGGAAVGALLGQVLGRDTSSTLKGAAAGAAAGTGVAALGGDLDFEIEAGRPVAFTLEQPLLLPASR